MWFAGLSILTPGQAARQVFGRRRQCAGRVTYITDKASDSDVHYQ